MNTPSITPDLTQNVIITVYLLFAHNYIAFAYFTGVIIGIILSLYRPSRFNTLILLGFAVLLFSFEYDKHIIDAFRTQTLNSLITVTPHYKLTKLINLIISELFPIFFYIAGWALIFTAIVSKSIKKEQGKN